MHCPERRTPGNSYPGGYAESMVAPADALAAVPDGMDLVDAAPMGCAGVTTFRAIREAGVRAGGRVAVVGLGGLGHLAVQFAARMGYETVAVARGPQRREAALGLGAAHYVDSFEQPAGAALAAMGGADLILNCAATTEHLEELLDGLRVHGRLTLVGFDGGDLTVPAARLVTRGQVITGHLTGNAHDIEETLAFARLHGVRPVVERMPLREAGAALESIAAGRAGMRIVLETDGSG